VDAALAANRARGLALEGLAAHLAGRLEHAGIRALPLKGPLLARRLHGDEGLRATNDLDLLVDREHVAEALEVVCAVGYEAEPVDPDQRADGLPELHYTLRDPAGRLTRIELHWRIDWYEDAFSHDLLERSEPGADGLREPAAADDLAALLLFHARDGLFGLRAPADVAAWWDRHGQGLGEPPLAPHWDRYPELRRPLVAAARAAERVAAVPADRLLPAEAHATARTRVAVRLASWSGDGEVDQLAANAALVDHLLSPPGGLRPTLRRHVFLTRRTLASRYGFAPGDAPRHAAWRVLHPPKVALRYLLGLAGALRRGP
jgi:hypothetical protein